MLILCAEVNNSQNVTNNFSTSCIVSNTQPSNFITRTKLKQVFSTIPEDKHIGSTEISTYTEMAKYWNHLTTYFKITWNLHVQCNNDKIRSKIPEIQTPIASTAALAPLNDSPPITCSRLPKTV